MHEETSDAGRVPFAISALDQHAQGAIDMRESDVQLEVTPPERRNHRYPRVARPFALPA